MLWGSSVRFYLSVCPPVYALSKPPQHHQRVGNGACPEESGSHAALVCLFYFYNFLFQPPCVELAYIYHASQVGASLRVYSLWSFWTRLLQHLSGMHSSLTFLALVLCLASWANGTSHHVRTTGNTVRFNLTLTWEEWAPAGIPRKMILGNGQLPSPLLELRQGDDVEFLVINNLPTNTTVHFHGRSPHHWI